jgi:NAD(P)-dependent dehydrogenase (short-subunit alcohol dehydrogenase family)
VRGNDNGRLKGKHAIVTGGARGIGKAIVSAFVEQGAEVIFCDLAKDQGRELQRQLGSMAVFVLLDVRDPVQWDHLCQSLRGKPLDVLVNNAGGRLSSRELHEVELEEWAQEIQLNLTSVFLGMRSVIPIMLSQGWGSIINISSISGVVGQFDAPGYQAAKAGVRLLSRNAAVTYAKRGIRVNTIVPGGIKTKAGSGQTREEYFLNATPMGRYGTPNDIASAAVFLAADESAFVTGSDIVVDGGFIAR